MLNASLIFRSARVSTDAQDHTHQLAQLAAAGCATIFQEKISGTSAQRPRLEKRMDKISAGDVVSERITLSDLLATIGTLRRQADRSGAG